MNNKTNPTQTHQDKHIEELIKRMSLRDLDVSRLERQLRDQSARTQCMVNQIVAYERELKTVCACHGRANAKDEMDLIIARGRANAFVQPDEPTNAHDDMNQHNRFLSNIWQGIKWTLVALVLFGGVSFLMLMGWTGGAV